MEAMQATLNMPETTFLGAMTMPQEEVQPKTKVDRENRLTVGDQFVEAFLLDK